MSAKSKSTRILSTSQTDVYDEDMQSLCPGQWLRSNVLAYAMQRLLTDCTLAGTTMVSEPIVVLDPSVVQAMVAFRSPEVGPITLIRQASVILAPVADYDAGSVSGNGDHWSLLVIIPRGSTHGAIGIHCDSIRGRNTRHAESIVQLLFPRQELVLRLHSCRWFPQQLNGCDCGVYAIMAARFVLDFLGRSGMDLDGLANCLLHSTVPLSKDNDQWSADKLRGAIAYWIEQDCPR